MACRDASGQREPALKAAAFLAPRIREIITRFQICCDRPIEEIRLRLFRPLAVEAGGRWLLKVDGTPTVHPHRAWIVEEEELRATIELMTESSLYTMEEELRQGFITLPGGHRAGLAGECLVEGGRLARIKTITGINLRVARELPGIARLVIPHLWMRERLMRTLIVSPPQAGKTTLLRDMVRALGDGDWNSYSLKVGLIDERSEIAGSFHGVPQLNIGIHTDVLDGCPKAEGIYRLLRAMGPEVVAVDEIGRPEEVEAVRDLLYAGVGVLATAHASSFEELMERPVLRSIVKAGRIERIILLSRRMGVGTVEAIRDEGTGAMLLEKPFRLEVSGG